MRMSYVDCDHVIGVMVAQNAGKIYKIHLMAAVTVTVMVIAGTVLIVRDAIVPERLGRCENYGMTSSQSDKGSANELVLHVEDNIPGNDDDD